MAEQEGKFVPEDVKKKKRADKEVPLEDPRKKSYTMELDPRTGTMEPRPVDRAARIKKAREVQETRDKKQTF